MSSPPKKITFAPTVPNPLPPVNVAERIKELKLLVDDTNPQAERVEQRSNILAVMAAYEDGTITGTTQTFFMDGVQVTREMAVNGPGWAWSEGGLGCQLVQKAVYGHGHLGPQFHEIHMLIRLAPGHGGDGTIYPVRCLNDTGSSFFTMFHTDFASLGNMIAYDGWMGHQRVLLANGAVERLPLMAVQVRLTTQNGDPWSVWISEIAILRMANPGAERLSGSAMRYALYCGTTPAHGNLGVSATKGGLSSVL